MDKTAASVNPMEHRRHEQSPRPEVGVAKEAGPPKSSGGAAATRKGLNKISKKWKRKSKRKSGQNATDL